MANIVSEIIGGAGANIVNAVGDQINKKAELETDLAKVAIQADAEVGVATAQTNTAQAQSVDKFTSRARPLLFYICSIAIALYYIPTFLVGNGLWIWGSIQAGHIVERPTMDITDMIGLVSLLLTGHISRTYEKMKKIA